MYCTKYENHENESHWYGKGHNFTSGLRIRPCLIWTDAIREISPRPECNFVTWPICHCMGVFLSAFITTRVQHTIYLESTLACTLKCANIRNVISPKSSASFSAVTATAISDSRIVWLNRYPKSWLEALSKEMLTSLKTPNLWDKQDVNLTMILVDD